MDDRFGEWLLSHGSMECQLKGGRNYYDGYQGQNGKMNRQEVIAIKLCHSSEDRVETETHPGVSHLLLIWQVGILSGGFQIYYQF